jgi:hypothetical protein
MVEVSLNKKTGNRNDDYKIEDHKWGDLKKEAGRLFKISVE